MNGLSIGEVSRESGLAVSAIRYYEDSGLLPQIIRQSNNRRSYDREVVGTLRFITSCRKNGMGLSDIRELQQKLGADDVQCTDAARILQQVIKEISAKIIELQDARKHLSKIASACNIVNCGESSDACNIEANMKASGPV